VLPAPVCGSAKGHATGLKGVVQRAAQHAIGFQCGSRGHIDEGGISGKAEKANHRKDSEQKGGIGCQSEHKNEDCAEEKEQKNLPPNYGAFGTVEVEELELDIKLNCRRSSPSRSRGRGDHCGHGRFSCSWKQDRAKAEWQTGQIARFCSWG